METAPTSAAWLPGDARRPRSTLEKVGRREGAGGSGVRSVSRGRLPPEQRHGCYRGGSTLTAPPPRPWACLHLGLGRDLARRTCLVPVARDARGPGACGARPAHGVHPIGCYCPVRASGALSRVGSALALRLHVRPPPPGSELAHGTSPGRAAPWLPQSRPPPRLAPQRLGPPPLVRDCVPARCALTGPWEHLRGRWRDWTSAILHCSLSDLCWLCRGVAGREGWWAQREVGGDGGGRCPCPVSRRRCRGPGLEPATLLPACPNLLRGPLLSPGPRHLPQPESVCGESQRSDCRLPVREWSGACGGVLSGDPGHGQQGEQGWELEPGPAHQDEAPPTPCRAAPPRPAPPRPARVPWAVLGSFFPCLPLSLCADGVASPASQAVLCGKIPGSGELKFGAPLAT